MICRTDVSFPPGVPGAAGKGEEQSGYPVRCAQRGQRGEAGALRAPRAERRLASDPGWVTGRLRREVRQNPLG